MVLRLASILTHFLNLKVNHSAIVSCFLECIMVAYLLILQCIVRGSYLLSIVWNLETPNEDDVGPNHQFTIQARWAACRTKKHDNYNGSFRTEV